MSIKDLYIRSYRKYKLYAERHGIEVKIKPVKRPTRASIKRVEEEHKKNKVMQSTYRWIDRVKVNQRKKEREKKKLEKGFKDAKKLLKRQKRKEKKRKKKLVAADIGPSIFIDGQVFAESVLDEIDRVKLYWASAYLRGNSSSLVDEKIQRLSELTTAIESVPTQELYTILTKTTDGGRLVYEEIMDYIHFIEDYASGQDEEMKEESSHALWLLHWYSDDEAIKKNLEKSARRTETVSNGLRPGKTIFEGKVEDFF